MQGRRRKHTKSRGGCTTCKQKKIKCDESKPACEYCTLRSLPCTFSSTTSSAPTTPNDGSGTPNTPSSRAPTYSTSVSASASASASTLLPPPSLPLPLQLQPLTSTTLWDVADLELLHFYTTSTSLTFSRVPKRRHVWQYVAPQIAFSNEFLLRGLLAVSALHMSRVLPDRKDSLRKRASAHHAIALPIYRGAVEHMNASSCHACAAFGSVIAMFELAQSEQVDHIFFPQAPSRSASNTSEWIQLLRGSSFVMASHWEELLLGPLEAVLAVDLDAERIAEVNPVESAKFLALEQLWTADLVPASDNEIHALKEALIWLSKLYTMLCLPSSMEPATVALSWFVRVPDRFLAMVNERQPAALILLAHFSLLLNKLDHTWWTDGMSRKLLREVHGSLAEELRHWIGWPLQDLVISEFQA